MQGNTQPTRFFAFKLEWHAQNSNMRDITCLKVCRQSIGYYVFMKCLLVTLGSSIAAKMKLFEPEHSHNPKTFGDAPPKVIAYSTGYLVCRSNTLVREWCDIPIISSHGALLTALRSLLLQTRIRKSRIYLSHTWCTHQDGVTLCM
jgi:hypothetical protein